jgi:hypothetical protein
MRAAIAVYNTASVRLGLNSKYILTIRIIVTVQHDSLKYLETKSVKFVFSLSYVSFSIITILNTSIQLVEFENSPDPIIRKRAKELKAVVKCKEKVGLLKILELLTESGRDCKYTVNPEIINFREHESLRLVLKYLCSWIS